MTCLGAKHLKFEGCSSTFYQNGRKNGYQRLLRGNWSRPVKVCFRFSIDRKCGFSSSVTMKYWREQDFQNLGVEVPEGHWRLILNMVTEIRSPKLKLGENRSFAESRHFWNPWTEECLVWSCGRICLSKTYQQIRKLSNLGAKVCLTAVKLQMFGYQACHVCTQLEHVFLSHVHA